MRKCLPWLLKIMIIIALVLPALLWFLTTWENKRNDLNCLAVFIIHNYGIRASLVMTIHINDDTGELFYDGPVYRNNETIGYLNRKIDFSINKDQSLTHFTQTRIERFQKDNLAHADASIILPEFFVSPSSDIYFDIIRYRDGAFFIKDNFPMFYCKDLR